MVKKRLTVADFFCGAGGFSEGFRQKGFKVVFALDNWLPAKLTHDLNHTNCKCELLDILNLDTPKKIDEIVPDTDIIIGSPPCVSFSGSNKAGKADKSLGIKLIEAYLRIIAWKINKGVTKYWILENVPNSGKYVKSKYTWKELGLPGKGKDLEIISRGILNAAEYGSPQTRKRFVCGNYPTPKKTHEEEKWITIKNVQECLKNPLSNQKPKKIKDPVYGFDLETKYLTDHFYNSIIADYEWKKARRLKGDHGYMGKMSFPENINKPSRTVMATISASTREAIIFNAIKSNKKVGYRIPTIREIACFMSFPITYQFEGKGESSKYKLIGNAVCCKLASALAESIAKKEKFSIKAYIPQKIIKPSFDLTGKKHIPKKPKLKKPDAKFTIHVPYIKIRSFRAELSNKDSNFKQNKIKWTSKLHYGSGKSAHFVELKQNELEEALKKIKGFSQFKKELKKIFGNLKISHNELQESYILNGQSKKINPGRALTVIRKLIDTNFDIKKLKEVNTLNSFNNENLKRKDIPTLVLISLYALNYFVSLLKKN